MVTDFGEYDSSPVGRYPDVWLGRRRRKRSSFWCRYCWWPVYSGGKTATELFEVSSHSLARSLAHALFSWRSFVTAMSLNRHMYILLAFVGVLVCPELAVCSMRSRQVVINDDAGCLLSPSQHQGRGGGWVLVVNDLLIYMSI